MALTDYISLEIDGQVADIDPKGQVPLINFSLEDMENFGQKQSATVFDIELPATLINDQIHNTLHDPSVMDNTPDGSKENFMPCKYIAQGQELLVGKYLVQSVSSTTRPEKYKGKIYGQNGDWLITLKDSTLSDFLNPVTHLFDFATIIQSWNYDGRSEVLDFVYAPVRYQKRFGLAPDATEEIPDPLPPDDNLLINDLRPSISIYWLLYRAFKSVGYRIVSTFMDLEYYRRSTLPWTWGGFDYLDDTRWEGLKFTAIQNTPLYAYFPPGGSGYTDITFKMWGVFGNFEGFPDLLATDDGSIKQGAFDNSGTFEYLPTGTLPSLWKWQYPSSGPLVLGTLFANFSVQVDFKYDAQLSGHVRSTIQWYKNGTMILEDPIFDHTGPVAGTTKDQDFVEKFLDVEISPGDWIGYRVYVFINDGSPLGNNSIGIYVEAFQLNFMRLGENSTVDLKGNYPKFKNYKLLDLLRGEIDLFDLQIQTDNVRKEIYIEPCNDYEIGGVKYPGYYNRKQIDWSNRVDVSKENILELFSDSEREQIFKFQDDQNDGGLKKIQDRNQTIVGLSKYVLPERFSTESKENENRFYSPVMHENHELFKKINGTPPQLIAIIPENISNTSSDAAENVYNPKRAYYKGNVSGAGGWSFNGIQYTTIPFMFAVNYMAGGENDPIFSYADQLINGQIGKGLMKKFFIQRLAIQRRGRRYAPINLMLNNYDVSNLLHRESIIIDNIEYVLVSINNYNPIEIGSCDVSMWQFVPIGQVDVQNSYPSIAGIQSGLPTNSFDVKYWSHLLLTTDIV